MNNPPLKYSQPGLYIHLPFCKTRCKYCAFCSVSETSDDVIGRFVQCLNREMVCAGKHWKHFDTVFVGGGSPSSIDHGHLKRIMCAVKKGFKIEKNSEITLEINPGDVTIESLKTWADIGFNRFSLGIQTLDSKSLRLLGRRHDRKEALQALELMRQWTKEHNQIRLEQFTYSVDLIMGIPGQNTTDWLETLHSVINYQPDHISCYQLTIEAGTPLAQQTEAGTIKKVTESLEAELYKLTHQFLTSNGYVHYEISNYAYTSQNFSRHNMKYWFHIPYLGLGPSAHSFDGHSRWWNISDIDLYCKQIENGLAVTDNIEPLDDLTRENESIFLQLRTIWGLKRDINGDGNELWEMLIKSGHLISRRGRMRPTLKGMMVADRIAAMLMEI
jgi:putative oxygen-independent coproporphyrinogen III oxidase